jgi:hypothetical protein
MKIRMITVHLFNGNENAEIKGCLVRVVSRDRIRIYQGNGDVLELNWDGDGQIEHEGVYYEDMEIDHGRA